MGRNGTNKDLKKIEGTDRYEDRNCRRGRQAHQSLKAYWILQYLINNATEQDPVSIGELINELDDRGIKTDRKSIYRDIREINIINYMLEDEDADVFDAEEAIENDVDGFDRLVIYDKARKGYYVSRRNYDETDIQLIVECIYSSKFLTEKQSDRLADIACRVISEGEATSIKHKLALFDRQKTDNKQVLNNIYVINEAMANLFNGEEKQPCKICFDEVRATIVDSKIKKVRRKWVGSPHYLAIYEGKYYLIFYAAGMPEKILLEGDSEPIELAKNQFFPMQLESMENVKCLYDEPLDGSQEFKNLDILSVLSGRYNPSLFIEALAPQEIPYQVVTLFVATWMTEKVLERFGRKDVFGEKDAVISQIDDYFFSYSNLIMVDNHFFDFVIENYPDIMIFGMSEEKQKEFSEYLIQRTNKYNQMLEVYKGGIDEEKVADTLENTVEQFESAVAPEPLYLSKDIIKILDKASHWEINGEDVTFSEFMEQLKKKGSG